MFVHYDGGFFRLILAINDILIGEMKMDNNEKSISYFAHEAEMARAERTQRRLWIASLVLTVALVASNAAWIIHILIR